MSHEWQVLTKMTGGGRITVERVRLSEPRLSIEGEFEPPPLAQLPAEDQVFVAEFVRAHGSIKEMERLFGVSYPTVKNRLNRIAAQLPVAEVRVSAPAEPGDLLTRLERGELTPSDVIAQLKGGDRDRHD